ncbi:hypothetical protein [Streptomyces sp. NBC_00199]|nr:hypothetical protein [Streptomyces sp. NBC_00199]MCX5263188.1 hypothetical protein [Streptomyces sp. NBC_00199]
MDQRKRLSGNYTPRRRRRRSGRIAERLKLKTALAESKKRRQQRP